MSTSGSWAPVGLTVDQVFEGLRAIGPRSVRQPASAAGAVDDLRGECRCTVAIVEDDGSVLHRLDGSVLHRLDCIVGSLESSEVLADQQAADAAGDARSCSECGCTDRFACWGSCRWVGDRLCSTCAEAA